MLQREERDGIVTLTIEHGKANALDVELLGALNDALEEASSARALVLTGAGKTFCAGVDLFRVLDGGDAYLRDLYAKLDVCLRRLFTFPAPVVTAANGHAIAGGCILLLCGDYRLMVEGDARVGVPELLVGLPIPSTAFEVVRAGVPPQHLASLVYFGRTLLPNEAFAMGLVDATTTADTLLERARAAAEKLASVDREVFSVTKRAVRGPAVERIEAGGAFDDELLALWRTPEAIGRIRTYLDSLRKR